MLFRVIVRLLWGRSTALALFAQLAIVLQQSLRAVDLDLKFGRFVEALSPLPMAQSLFDLSLTVESIARSQIGSGGSLLRRGQPLLHRPGEIGIDLLRRRLYGCRRDIEIASFHGAVKAVA